MRWNHSRLRSTSSKVSKEFFCFQRGSVIKTADELKAGKKPSDAGDLKTYYNEVKSKMQAGAFDLSKQSYL